MNKNRRFVKAVSTVILASFIALSLASCVGESAYEIAVRNGFEGSESEWLESLVGKNGTDGRDGKDGENGTDGKDGENGKDGQNGKDGEDGKDGASSDGSAAASAASAIRTSVSIFCKFKKYQYVGIGKDPTVSEYTGNGAGVIYRLDKENGNAYIVTNYHVVYDSSSSSPNGISEDITLYLYGLQYKEMAINATFVGGSATYDLAVLKIENSDILKNSNATATELFNSDDVAVGTLAVAIGNPNSDGISVTSGIISVDSENVKMNMGTGSGSVEMRLMRMDTPVNHGSSGGGLFDGKGRLIGIVNAKLESSDVENIGYAIPANIVYAVSENVINNYERSSKSGMYKAVLGLMLKTDDVCSVYDEASDRILIRESVVVSQITAGSVADGTLKVGDKLISVSCNGISREINRRFTASEFVMSLGALDEVVFIVERDGATIEVKITLEESIFSRVS